MPHDDDGLDGMSDQQLNGLVSREIFGSTFADEDCEGWAADPCASAELLAEIERRDMDYNLTRYKHRDGSYVSDARVITDFDVDDFQYDGRVPMMRAIAIAALRAVRASKGEGR